MATKNLPPGHPFYKPYNQREDNTLRALSSHMPTKEVPKLSNMSGENMCFVNTSVQLIRSIRLFQEFFTTNAWINRPKISGFGQILTKLDSIFSGTKTSAEHLRNLVATASPGQLDMASGNQQDLEEFLRLLLQEIEFELVTLGLSNIVSDNFKSRDKIVKKFLREEGISGV